MENVNHPIEKTDTINIREELENYLIYWRVFVLCIVVAITAAYLYLRYTTPIYTASTSIMIKDNNMSGISAELAAFEDLGIVGGGSSNNTDNEIEVLKSRKIIGGVVDSLHLDILYFSEGRVKQSELYQKSPIRFSFIDKDATLIKKDTLISLSIVDDNSFQLKNSNDVITTSGKFGATLNSELGTFRVTKNNSIFPEFITTSRDIKIHFIPSYEVISAYKNEINIAPVSKNSSVIILSLKNPVKEKAENFLDEVVKQYNMDAINDKNQVSIKTKDFIENRLKSVGKELAFIQDSIQDFKVNTGFTGVSNEGELILENLSRNNERILALQTQLRLAEWIQEYINSQAGTSELLPENLGFENSSITEAITTYNILIARKNRLMVNAGEKNPELVQLRKEIEDYKQNLKQNLRNLKNSLELQYNQIEKEQSKISAKKSSIPVIERGFIDIRRQQEIIAGLFSYLLKKKEETAISLAVTVPNAKIIDMAYGSNIPVSPKKNIIYLAALLLGIVIPFSGIYLKNVLDTKVHTKKDVEEHLTIPYLGDIPKSESDDKIIVNDAARSSAAEAFRLIRTNLDFILNTNTDECKTIFITSTTSGEGKSFISINTAAVLAMSGKKVLLVGMDLRAPKVTEYLGLPDRKGITNYITNDNLSLDELKFTIPNAPVFDIISSGVIPPNPAELLMTKKVDEMFSALKKEYEYIIVDTAPINLVTDTLLIAKHADMFMYIVRANYLDKRLLAVPQNLYREKRLPNMSIVLNGTDSKRGYGYGYGGYGYLAEEKKPWYKRILSS